MTATQYSVISSVKKAKKPEDLFGLVSTDVSKQKETLEKIKQVFWKMSKVIHPDIYKAKDASELFDKLNRLRNEAEKKCTGEKDPLYNSNGVLVKPVEFKSRHFTYSLFRRIANGGTCGIFEGVAKDRLNNTVNVIARAAKSSKDSDLMEREAKAFEIFNRKLKDISQWEDGKKAAERFSWKIPYFVESVKLKEPHSDKLKVVNIFSRLEEYKTGWYSLEDIHERYPQGVDMRIAAFIFNRILEALTLSHNCGVVHGAITPNHVLVHAKTHVGNLIDWTSSCHSGITTVPFMDKRYTDFFAPETLNTKVAFASSDIYMAAKCMVYLIGEDHVWTAKEEPVRKVLNACLQPNRALRLTAQQAFEKFRQALRDTFGAPKFVELTMTQKV